MLKALQSVEKLARGSKLQRILHDPIRYWTAISYRQWVYPRSHEVKWVPAQTFYGTEMTIGLPASTDIYLTGAKTHDSEIRLARFLIRRLHASSVFVDIGAHYGYFSLLVASIIDLDAGHILAVEAAPSTYDILHRNLESQYTHLTAENRVLSDQEGEATFYEFPNLYSEYNALDISQYQNEPWYDTNQPKAIQVPSSTLDGLLSEHDLTPDILKIDVEGAELLVMSGATHLLSQSSPVLILEFVNDPRRDSDAHPVADLLGSYGFAPHAITSDGELEPMHNLPDYMSQHDSDNIVFMKPN